MKKQSGTQQIGTKISVLTGAIFLVSIVSVLFLCVFMFRGLIMDMLENECVNGTNLLAYELSRQTVPQRDDTGLLDDLKTQTGCEFTIFENDVRICTTIVQDGQRAVGTKLSESVADVVLKEGKTFVGEASILGVPHLCSYVPTRDASGQINGLIFSGVPSAEAMARMNRAVLSMSLAGLLVLALGVFLIYSYTRRFVSKPLKKLTLFAQTVEKGNLNPTKDSADGLGIASRDEIGLLAEAFQITIDRIRAYIGEIARVLSVLSSQDLTPETTLDYVGDFASIETSLNEITKRLNQTIHQVSGTSEQVLREADQVSAGAQTLSQGAAEQAASVEALVDSLTEVSGQIQRTAENAHGADDFSRRAAAELQTGRTHMEQMVFAMSEINRSSEQIQKIIKVIEDIAFQTNILALNAAVEAARAGTAGKGFSVVADEVRALASKSSAASKDSAELIHGSMQSVQKGVDIAVQTSRLMDQVSSSNETAALIRDISVLSQEQSQQVEQIMNRMEQISSVVQMNSSAAEESAVASEKLSAQAQMLEGMISQFRLKEPAAS